jgi:nucleoside-diphosphate-sugar epimerase
MTNSGYGDAKGGICTEESPLNPTSVYGKTKCDAENLIVKGKHDYIIFRLATVFGLSPKMRTDLLVNDFVWRAVHDKSLVLFEHKFLRNFVHIRDVGRAFIFAIDNWNMMKNHIYNLGHPRFNVTKLRLAEMIKKEIPEMVIIIHEGKTDPDKRDYIVSNKKILATGFKFEYPLDKGIKELIEGYKSIKDTKFKNWDDAG